MTAQFVGPKNDVKKSSSIQVVEIFCLVFYFIRLPRALIDEAPHGLRVSHTQAMRLLHFVVALKLLIADGDKMRPAKRVTFQRRTGSQLTALDTAPFLVRHCQRIRSACRTASESLRA